jgi:hypothetical protein
MDVVKDYLMCHSLKPNVEAFSQAVVLATQHGMVNSEVGEVRWVQGGDVEDWGGEG